MDVRWVIDGKLKSNGRFKLVTKVYGETNIFTMFYA